MPIKQGKTIKLPMTYHGNLFPHFVSNLSENTPVIGVHIPSAICPERTHSPARLLDKWTILIKYQVR